MNSPISIIVPQEAVLGTTTMRVSSMFDTEPDVCGKGFDGEVEDYSLVIDKSFSINKLEGSQITLGPNPTSGILEFYAPEACDVQISDATGRVVLDKQSVSGRTNLNLSGNASGMYFVKITMHDKIYGTFVILK